MAEVKISIDIQVGKEQKNIVIGVPEEITRNDLIEWAKGKYPSLKDVSLAVLIEWDENKPGSARLLEQDTNVLIRPKSTVADIRVYSEGNNNRQ